MKKSTLSKSKLLIAYYWDPITNEFDEKLMTLKWINWSLFTISELYLRRRDTYI